MKVALLNKKNFIHYLIMMELNNIHKLNYKFSLNDRFIHTTDEANNYYSCSTPFLKVLKPFHITLNKKKTISKKYLILETNDEMDFNNEIGEFMFIINKVHEISQEKIRENSVKWFNTEFDDIGLDIKIKRPIDEQRDNQFIKISIPKDDELEKDIEKLSKGDYILANIVFKGLKVASDYITEEWELKNFIIQEKFDKMQNCDDDNTSKIIDQIIETSIYDLEISNELNNKDITKEIIIEKYNLEKEEYDKQLNIEENIIEENIIEENIIKENIIEEHNLEEKINDSKNEIEINEIDNKDINNSYKNEIYNNEPIEKICKDSTEVDIISVFGDEISVLTNNISIKEKHFKKNLSKDSTKSGRSLVNKVIWVKKK